MHGSTVQYAQKVKLLIADKRTLMERQLHNKTELHFITMNIYSSSLTYPAIMVSMTLKQ